MDALQGGCTSTTELDKDVKQSNSTFQEIQEEKNPNNVLASEEVLGHVKLSKDIQVQFPAAKVNCVSINKHTQMDFTRDKLKNIQKRLKQAFIEFYYKLRLLKNYR